MLTREITPEDVDFDNAYKIYVGTNIFDLQTINYHEILSHLEDGVYVYEIPIRIGELTFIANAQLQTPIAEDDYERVSALLSADALAAYEERAGTWVVSVLREYNAENPFLDYYDTAARVSGVHHARPILVGALPGFTQAVALYPDEAGNVGMLVPTARRLAVSKGKFLYLTIYPTNQSSISTAGIPS